ncbi:hypothetical protein ACFYXH_08310 [Streptomyces sp. NPDC002730]|uniref:hypothetical protein n=1 Tax=Streptomyces sp. NPDC002730 TaxID=3364662 RepID=UPI0036993DBD
MSLAATVIAWLPLAVAGYPGGVLTGRELERRTAALSWTQSVTPARRLAAKLTLPALLVAAGFAMLSLLYRWARSVGISGFTFSDEWYYDDVFRALGPVDVAYALCGLAIGALSGLLLRRALPAAGLALVVTGFLMVAAERYREQSAPGALGRGLREAPGRPPLITTAPACHVVVTGHSDTLATLSQCSPLCPPPPTARSPSPRPLPTRPFPSPRGTMGS